MNPTEYQEMIKNMTPKEKRFQNMVVSFITGGLVGTAGALLFTFFSNHYTEELSISFTLLILIIAISALTALGIADDLFSRLKCGLIIPITGFAHSISSAIIDYKKEGFLSIGSNTFKLAGSVLLYGIVSSVILALLAVIIHG